jgi:hypothetical protein
MTRRDEVGQFVQDDSAMQLKDLLGQVHANDRYFLHSQLLLIQHGSQWHKCRQEGLPNSSSMPTLPDVW